MYADLIRPLGQAMRPLRAGIGGLTSNRRELSSVPNTIRVTSPAFAPGQDMPVRYTADGAGISPPLAWTGLPPGTVSTMLLIEDPDIPAPFPLVHALVIGLRANQTELHEGAIPYRVLGGHVAGRVGGVTVGRGGFGRAGWVAPTPPPGHGAHHYAFQVFALDDAPRFDWAPGRGYALRQTIPHMLARGTLFGVYERV